MGQVMSLVMLGGGRPLAAVHGPDRRLVGLGAWVALVFAGGGALIVLAALVGVPLGVPTHCAMG